MNYRWDFGPVFQHFDMLLIIALEYGADRADLVVRRRRRRCSPSYAAVRAWPCTMTAAFIEFFF